MSAHDEPRIARQRFTPPRNPDVAARDAIVAQIVGRAEWLVSKAGRASMEDKDEQPVSVCSGMVQSVLEIAGENGMSPLQVVELALLGYSAVLGRDCGPVNAAHARIKELLDEVEAAGGRS